MEPYYLLFDFETTGIGPLKTQRAIQLAWSVLDSNFKVIENKNFYISEIKEINTNFHKTLTTDFLNENGKKIKWVLYEFISNIEIIIGNRGKLVAHNIDFDLSILFNEIRQCNINYGRTFNELLNRSYCTMMNSINICNIKSHNFNGLKYPRLVELYRHFYKKEPEIELHHAQNDVKILHACLIKLFNI